MDVSPRLEIGARRVGAWCVDWLLIAVWAGVVAGVGALARVQSWGLDRLGQNLLAFATMVAPVTLALAWREGRGATPGKRSTRVAVVDEDTAAPIGFGRALVRNAVKVAAPWTLAHAMVVELAATGSQPGLTWWVIPAAVGSYGLAAWYLVAVFVRRGRTPYDWLAGTVVIRP